MTSLSEKQVNLSQQGLRKLNCFSFNPFCKRIQFWCLERRIRFVNCCFPYHDACPDILFEHLNTDQWLPMNMGTWNRHWISWNLNSWLPYSTWSTARCNFEKSQELCIACNYTGMYKHIGNNQDSTFKVSWQHWGEFSHLRTLNVQSSLEKTARELYRAQVLYTCLSVPLGLQNYPRNDELYDDWDWWYGPDLEDK